MVNGEKILEFLAISILAVSILSLQAEAANIPVATSPFCPSNTSSDTYYINTNVVFNCTTPVNINTSDFAIVLNASNIYLDCNGTEIFGNNTGYDYKSIGIHAAKPNVTIKNCVIHNFYKAINIQSVSNVSVFNATLFKNGRIGDFSGAVSLLSASKVNISNSNISENYAGGISFSSSNNNTVEYSEISRNGYKGVYVQVGNYNAFRYNNINENQWAGLYVESTAQHWDIRYNNVSNNRFYGIALWWGSFDDDIINNTIVNNSHVGLFLYTAQNHTIVNNTFLNSGLFIDSGGISVENNTIENNTVNGLPILYLENAENLILSGTISQVFVVNGSNITIKDTAFYNNSVGVELIMENRNITIINNTFVNSGIYLEELYTDLMNYTIINNTVNGKPLVFIRDDSNKVIEDAGQVILMNSSNITIRGLDVANIPIGLEAINVSNISITNSRIFNTSHEGIVMAYALNSTIEKTFLSGCGFVGILVYSGISNSIRDNSLYYNYPDAIDTAENYTTIYNNSISYVAHDGISHLGDYYINDSNNTVINARWCVSITSGEGYYDNIENNKLFNCTVIALASAKSYYTKISNNYIQDSFDGVYLWQAAYNYTVSGNIIKDIVDVAIRMNGPNHTISNNTATNSTYGIYLYSVTNSSVTNNSLFWNNYAIYSASSNYNNITGNKACYNTKAIYNNTATNKIANNTFCADFSVPSWTASLSNLSAYISNIFFIPTSCYLKIDDNLLASNSSVADNLQTTFNFTPITSEGEHYINLYCNDSSANYVNSSASFVVGDISIISISFEPSSPMTTDEIRVTVNLYSTDSSTPLIKIYFDGEEVLSKFIDISSGQNAYTFSIGKRPSGTHIIRVQIDADNSYDEMNEGNNIGEKDIYIKLYQRSREQPQQPSQQSQPSPQPQCPTCPSCGPWSDCLGGEQIRTCFVCSAATNYTCAESIERRACNITQPSENETPITNTIAIVQSAANMISAQPQLSPFMPAGSVVLQPAVELLKIISAIIERPVTCGNGTCDANENVYNCSLDCHSPEDLSPVVSGLVFLVIVSGWALKQRALRRARARAILRKRTL